MGQTALEITERRQQGVCFLSLPALEVPQGSQQTQQGHKACSGGTGRVLTRFFCQPRSCPTYQLHFIYNVTATIPRRISHKPWIYDNFKTFCVALEVSGVLGFKPVRVLV